MAKRNHGISAESARQLFDCDATAGTLRWKAKTVEQFAQGGKRLAETMCKSWNSRFAGKEAGSDDGRGYVRVGLNNTRYWRHRLIWLIETGAWPSDEIDHKFGVEAGDGFENLREANHLAQSHNLKFNIKNKSGYRGVSWHARAKKWEARISVKGHLLYLGLFTDPKEASATYLEAKKHHHVIKTPREFLP